MKLNNWQFLSTRINLISIFRSEANNSKSFDDNTRPYSLPSDQGSGGNQRCVCWFFSI